MQGNAVVSYTYDPWGVPTATGNTTIAEINPCTYRGYDYDEDTGYFYLQSRYYDPTVGRFLNLDEPLLLGVNETILSYNLYAYCASNPIIGFDPTGHAMINVIFAAIGAVVGWKIGAWVANLFGYYSGAKYNIIRAGVALGFAAISWISANKLISAAFAYLQSNPGKLLSLIDKYGAVTVTSWLKFLGLNPFKAAGNTGKFIAIGRVLNGAVVFSYKWALQIYNMAKALGFEIELHGKHGNYTWHMHLYLNGKKINGVHIEIVESAWKYLKTLIG